MNVPTRLLLGPGPSPVDARVMAALGSPVLSHLDPFLLDAMDDLRARLARVFRAKAGALTLAVSGTGTAAMEAAVANVTQPGDRALVVVTGYFGDRLAQMFQRYGADVRRLQVEWGRACDPDDVRRLIQDERPALVGIVHAETSTGVLNPVDAVASVAAEAGTLLVVDAVTSLGAMPLDVSRWGASVCYSCAQKGLGAPSGLSPITFSPEALARRSAARSFSLDIGLLEDYWVRRKYHHTISSPLVLALREAVAIVEAEGLDERFERHRRSHLALVEGLDRVGLDLLPRASERLWTLNAVRVPEDIDEATVRRGLLEDHGIEIGAGLGPLAGRIWRVGLMGAGSTASNVEKFLAGLATTMASARA